MIESPNLTGNESLALTGLTKEIRRLWPLARIKLFGSKATGTFDDESDVDVLVLLPCPVTETIRKQIVHKLFEINLAHESNISVLIVSEEEWDSSTYSFLPIRTFIEKEGIALRSSQGELRDVIRYWLEKANESLAAAEDEMRANRFSFSVNRIYYACFYVVRAFLLQQSLLFKKHSGVRASFHKHLVKPGFVSLEHGKLYEELFEARQRGDYLELVRFERAQVEEWLIGAREFVCTVHSLINDRL